VLLTWKLLLPIALRRETLAPVRVWSWDAIPILVDVASTDADLSVRDVMAPRRVTGWICHKFSSLYGCFLCLQLGNLSIKFGVLLVLLAVRDALVERCPRGGKFGLCVCELLLGGRLRLDGVLICRPQAMIYGMIFTEVASSIESSSGEVRENLGMVIWF